VGSIPSRASACKMLSRMLGRPQCCATATSSCIVFSNRVARPRMRSAEPRTFELLLSGSAGRVRATIACAFEFVRPTGEGSREMKPIRQDGSSADECEKLKIDLARAIATTLKRRDLAQVEAAKIIGVDESKVSALIRGRLTGYSVDRLVRYLIALGNDVDVQISGRGGNRDGRIKVVVT